MHFSLITTTCILPHHSWTVDISLLLVVATVQYCYSSLAPVLLVQRLARGNRGGDKEYTPDALDLLIAGEGLANLAPMNYKPAASTQQAPMAIAPPRAACRPSFTFLLCCDRCQVRDASLHRCGFAP